MEEKKLITEFSNGSEQAFGDLMKKYLKPIYNFLRQIVKDPQAADQFLEYF